MTQVIFQLFTRAGAEWVMDLLAALSVASIAVILERGLYFLRRGAEIPGIVEHLKAGRLGEARAAVGDRRGLEAEVALAALDAADGGPAAVQEAVACAVAESRPAYERGLSFLGTLGNNAPFLGLFGTVVGIIRAFSDLAVGGPKGAGAAAVMSGIPRRWSPPRSASSWPSRRWWGSTRTCGGSARSPPAARPSATPSPRTSRATTSGRRRWPARGPARTTGDGPWPPCRAATTTPSPGST